MHQVILMDSHAIIWHLPSTPHPLLVGPALVHCTGPSRPCQNQIFVITKNFSIRPSASSGVGEKCCSLYDLLQPERRISHTVAALRLNQQRYF